MKAGQKVKLKFHPEQKGVIDFIRSQSTEEARGDLANGLSRCKIAKVDWSHGSPWVTDCRVDRLEVVK